MNKEKWFNIRTFLGLETKPEIYYLIKSEPEFAAKFLSQSSSKLSEIDLISSIDALVSSASAKSSFFYSIQYRRIP